MTDASDEANGRLIAELYEALKDVRQDVLDAQRIMRNSFNHNSSACRCALDHIDRALASVDTHRDGGDAKRAPGASLSGAVPEGQTPKGGSHA